MCYRVLAIRCSRARMCFRCVCVCIIDVLSFCFIVVKLLCVYVLLRSRFLVFVAICVQLIVVVLVCCAYQLGYLINVRIVSLCCYVFSVGCCVLVVLRVRTCGSLLWCPSCVCTGSAIAYMVVSRYVAMC